MTSGPLTVIEVWGRVTLPVTICAVCGVVIGPHAAVSILRRHRDRALVHVRCGYEEELKT